MLRAFSKSSLCSAMDWFASVIAWLACSRGVSRMPAHPPSRSVEREITTTSAQRFIMCAMNEGSLPSFASVRLRSLPRSVGLGLGRLFGRLRRRRGVPPAPEDPTLRSLAASAGEHEGGHAFDREVERGYPAFRLSDGNV